MLTTIDLDETLLMKARERAAEQGVSLSELVNGALRQALGPPLAHPPFTMITYGPVSPGVAHEPGAFAVIEDSDDSTSLIP